jgi:predicted dehydrogenase
MSVLAIVGGGRWGQVLLSVVAEMKAPFDRVVMVSKTADPSRIPVEILPTVGDLLAKYAVKAAIVVNAAAQHFATARQLIHSGVPVLIEKPIVLSSAQMQVLIAEAKQHHVSLVPGLNYRFSSYIKQFAAEVAKRGMPQHFFLKWSDTQNEIRHGKIKKYDASISVVQDVMPHIWTILSMVFQHPKIHMHSCLQDNTSAALSLTINNVAGEVLLQRHGAKRQRYLSLQFETETLALDFASEPGVIFMDSRKISADPLWEQKPGPLSQQLAYFFSVVTNGQSTAEDLQCCLDSVACSEMIAR